LQPWPLTTRCPFLLQLRLNPHLSGSKQKRQLKKSGAHAGMYGVIFHRSSVCLPSTSLFWACFTLIDSLVLCAVAARIPPGNSRSPHPTARSAASNLRQSTSPMQLHAETLPVNRVLLHKNLHGARL
jgi:hypothetical protein